MAAAKDGDTVQIHYTGKFPDGEVFDSSEGRAPLEFKIGTGQVIAGFNDGVIGMEVGQSKTVNIPAKNGYGEYKEEFILRVSPSDIPPEIKPEVGMALTMHQEDGGEIPVRITEVTAEQITLDANHPLSGKELVFDIELVSVEE